MISESWSIFVNEGEDDENSSKRERGKKKRGASHPGGDPIRDVMKGKKQRVGRDDVRNKERQGSFKCSHCNHMIPINVQMGTHNRNHCPDCLWSKHLDIKPGDRKSDCNGGMKPIGLTFKKTNSGVLGEIMIVHSCCNCSEIHVNRIAADDAIFALESIFQSSLQMSGDERQRIIEAGLHLANNATAVEIHSQLFGKTNLSKDR